MRPDPNRVKVCVNVDGTDNLDSIDVSLPLDMIIYNLCKEYNKPNPELYGLQISVDQHAGQFNYVTEENLKKIVHGSVLKLLPSIDFMIKSILEANEYDEQKQLMWLKKFSTDSAFVKKLSLENLQILLVKCSKCCDENFLNYLIVISSILNLTTIKFVTEEFILFLINFLKSAENISLEMISAVLQVLEQILLKYKYFNLFFKSLKLSELVTYLWREENCEIQLHTLKIINAYVVQSRSKTHFDLIEELNYQQYKNIIARYVIKNAIKSENAILSHELYVYQTYLFNEYVPYTVIQVFKGSNQIQKCPREAYIYENRNSTMDFDEYKRNTISSRSSYDSSSSGGYVPIYYFKSDLGLTSSNKVVTTAEKIDLRQKQNLSEISPAYINQLTSICLDYYEAKYKKNYNLSILVTNHEPGFYRIADQVTKIVCKLLHIGREPDDNSTCFQPLVFICVEKKRFVEELFCRALWLLARTRREMKAKTLDDHEKVLIVLEYQLKLALDTKPFEYNVLTENLKKNTHDKVFKMWEKEREFIWNNTLQNNPNLEDLRQKICKENEQLIYEQRMNVLHKGKLFPKLPEKSKGKIHNWHIRLSPNRLKFIYGDCTEDGLMNKSYINEVPISNITHVVAGVVCPHVKDHRVRKADIPRCFSLLLTEELSLDFLADDVDTANQWIDGLHALLGKPMTSDLYHKDLNELLIMDLNLHLLDLQDFQIPTEVPPVPPLPEEYANDFSPKPINIVGSRSSTLSRDETYTDASLC